MIGDKFFDDVLLNSLRILRERGIWACANSECNYSDHKICIVTPRSGGVRSMHGALFDAKAVLAGPIVCAQKFTDTIVMREISAALEDLDKFTASVKKD